MSNGGNDNLFDVKYKVLLLGDTLVGKTSLQRFIAGKDFRTDIGATIGMYMRFNFIEKCQIELFFLGVDFVNKIIPVEQSKINLQIW
jgi:GTPase SAR1 family protein